ncbi:ribosomal protection-like ABC-F family protein [Actinophytocola xanthii]|uniref:ABC transporter ATP-binding protein n=1 Tax=Actinophytocola xanthii TaxID=1912961 RepID=A0A1Q8CRD7_9PSEU|nr:ABC-F family ATP-binding cassette domain-containing protein [Actinophytocola xanthii]OLF16884.1 ABC transporter ATP-binding protein [Actinophytocola xanthii]
MPTQLTLRDVRKSFGERLLFDGVSLAVRPGERVGVVGENGSGKSTLLRLLAGRERPDEGEVVVVASGLGYLGQTPELAPDQTVGDAIDNALADLRAMERRMRELESVLDDPACPPAELAEYGDLLTAFELRDGYQADARVDWARHALGLAAIGRDRRLGTLSGGEQARLGLACLLAAAPEVMLLDEPTNHLDAAALGWLEDRLRAHRGTVVAVSHDRVFLERVATAIVEVDGDRASLTRHGEGYRGYLSAKAAARHRWEQSYRRWCAEVEELTEFAATTAHRVAPGREMKDRNKVSYSRHGARVQSSVSSRVRNAQERLRRLHATAVPRPPDPLRLTADLSGGSAGAGVELRGVRVGERLRVPEFAVGGRQRVLVHGPNGAGKTTLLRVLAGALEPDEGSVVRRGRIGYLAQEVSPDHPRRTLLAAFGAGRPGTPEEHAERLCSLGLFRRADLTVPVGVLSAGQRRRLSLARLVTGRADLLLLDEPANHLSLTLVEELETAVDEFPGALVVVSHDRALRRRFRGSQVELVAGRLVS